MLIHTVQVYRRTESSPGVRVTDRFHQEESVNPRQHEVDGETLHGTYPCRLTRGRGGLTMMERSVDVFETRFKLYTMLNVDINADDAVRVLDETGAELLGISKIAIKSQAADALGGHHLEFDIWSQGGPN